MSPANDFYLPQRTLVNQQDASIVEDPSVPRSSFRNRYTVQTAFDAGLLIPFIVDEVLPGDHFKYRIHPYIRMQTLLFPNFSSLRVDTFLFFCPNRLVWDNWVKFMGEQTDPDDSTDYTIPQVVSNANGFPIASVYDFMGIPGVGQITTGENLSVNALPLRMYNLIYNVWFRDQNLTDSQQVPRDNGPDSNGLYPVLRRAKSHDYFTSCLPWPQKGTAPFVPLLGQAPVSGIGALNQTATATNLSVYETPGGGATTLYSFAKGIDEGISNREVYLKLNADPGFPQVFAELSEASGVNINMLRQTFMVQALLERDARGGTRYAELIWHHFKVRNPDFRLQRPEYIGGGQSPLMITPIAQTTPTDDGALGALGATGTATAPHPHTASYAATEHGFIIGLINVRSELAYQQGLHRQWSRLVREDYYFPSLAQLGEQAVLRKEIYAVGNATLDDTVFGYQEAHHEYRTRYSRVTGLMRSTATPTLDMWHVAQHFGSPPTLSDTFIKDTPPISRIIAAGETATNQQFLADILVEQETIRPIPVFGTPANLGRF